MNKTIHFDFTLMIEYLDNTGHPFQRTKAMNILKETLKSSIFDIGYSTPYDTEKPIITLRLK